MENQAAAEEKERQKESLNLSVEILIDRLENEKDSISNRELINLFSKHFRNLTTFDPHIFHELAETALNLLIKRKYASGDSAKNDPVNFVAGVLKPLAARLPTQTWRSRTQVIRQQFSTPPAVAFLLAYLVNCRGSETVLEPSAGTGSLLAWIAGAETRAHVNEIDPRRRQMLELLGFAPTGFNAEFIHDYLPPEVQPSCLLMNPPFSSSGGCTERHSSRYGFRHVRSALERLKKGGRFGIILGEAAGLDTKTGEDFWGGTSGAVNVKAIIKIGGREYYKNGTSIDINLIVGEKLLAERKNDPRTALKEITNVSAKSVEEALEKSENLNLRLSY